MNPTEPTHPEPSLDSVARFRRWTGVTVGLTVIGYLLYAVLHGLAATAAELRSFSWPLYVPILGLTLVNYGLRYFKWAWLLSRLGVAIPHRINAQIFIAGLGMVISPGKAGELVKPWLVREITGEPILKTLPALVTERMTDGLAVVILAAFGVSTYYAEGASLIYGTLFATIAGTVVLSIEGLANAVLGLIGAVPGLAGIAERLRVAYGSMRTCLTPGALVVTLIASLIAWWAECVGYWLVFEGLGVEAGLDASTFLYAFATVFGAPSPGGMGMADAALAEGARVTLPHITEAQAVAAALLVRVATLWFGVLLGAFTLMRVDDLIAEGRRQRS